MLGPDISGDASERGIDVAEGKTKYGAPFINILNPGTLPGEIGTEVGSEITRYGIPFINVVLVDARPRGAFANGIFVAPETIRKGVLFITLVIKDAAAGADIGMGILCHVKSQ